MFPVGAEVEVRSDDPGFEASFYEATVAGHLTSTADRYTLSYSTLLAEKGGPLVETAAAADVRPRPPPPPAPREFAVCDMVEAFHNEGWWAGVVSAVPATGRRRGAYGVTFPTSRETMEFEGTALRPHRVFQDGRWVPAAEVVSEDNVSQLFSEGNQVEVSMFAKSVCESWIPATVLKVIAATHFLVQYMDIEKNGELTTEIVHSRYIWPARTVSGVASRHRFSPSSHVEVFHQGSWWPGVIVKVLGSSIDKKYVVKVKNHERDIVDVDCAGAMTVQNTQLRPRYDWDGEKWVRYIKEKPAKGPRSTARKRCISTILDLYDERDKAKPGSCRDKKLKKAESISLVSREETMEQRNVGLALGSLLSIPSPPPMAVAALGHLSSSSLAPSCHLEQSSQMIIVPYMPHGPFLGTTDLSRQKGECVVLQTTDAPGESTETAKIGIAAKTSEEDDGITVSQLPNDDKTAGREILSETHTGSCIGLTPPRNEIRGSQECLTKEFSDSSQSTERSTATRNCAETEPGNNNSLALAIQDLPFVKTFPLWAELEALEIFRKAPQRPHFRQLQDHPPVFHEGMAFGLMLSFSNLAEIIGRLEIQEENGPLLQENEKMLALSLLEANGFDVGDLKSRLEALVDAKKSRDAMKRLEEIIARKEADDRELSARIRMMAVALHRLELDAYLVRSVARAVISRRMSNAVEISELKAELGR